MYIRNIEALKIDWSPHWHLILYTTYTGGPVSEPVFQERPCEHMKSRRFERNSYMWCWTLTMSVSALTWADLTTALVFLAVFVLVLYGMSSPGKRIPGPFALPIVGNLFMFVRRRQRSHIELLKLKEKYGDVFRLYIGPFRLIVISGYGSFSKNVHNFVFSQKNV